ncbi:unnamed protein product [Spirodela intermedia]|uniref:Uncharacterized protein n=1 Tax=Spirodela intermedia TaxID=51605 RepID=A0A7I8I9P7_SPIIN|nr:unnamed protein product [Spirodela intermedia]CAA6654143.1 unnamed protein product [Spirodela intermedia]
MDVAVELEDDLFFADLSRQIALLIFDEEEEEEDEGFPLRWCPSHSFQVRGLFSPYIFAGAAIACGGEQVKGTGVFIPQSSLPRWRRRPGRPRRPAPVKPKMAAGAAHGGGGGGGGTSCCPIAVTGDPTGSGHPRCRHRQREEAAQLWQEEI